MKKITTLFSVLLVFFSYQLLAQNISISDNPTIPNPSALLDVNSNNKGVSIPNVSLLATNNGLSPIYKPKTGLLVYNTNSTTGSFSVVPDFYYWSGPPNNKWTLIPENVAPLASNKLFFGIAPPSSTVNAMSGDFYIQKNGLTNTLYGPLSGSPLAWPSVGTDLNGKMIYYGVLPPNTQIGAVDGDYYIMSDNLSSTPSYTMYGPKRNGVWPSIGVVITKGKNANVILSGTDPVTTQINAVDGNYYMMSDGLTPAGSYTLYGPKSNGQWPTSGLVLHGASYIPWGTLGNSASLKSNYFGTKDATDLAIRTNSLERIVIEGNTGNVGIPITPDYRTILDISANNKAVSLPNGLIQNVINPSPLTAPLKKGWMMYNTFDNGSLDPTTRIKPEHYYTSGPNTWRKLNDVIPGIVPTGPLGSKGSSSPRVISGVLTTGMTTPLLTSGIDGDFFIDKVTSKMYGPKNSIAAVVWPVIPAATLGIGSETGLIKFGTDHPNNTISSVSTNNGDFYINTVTKEMYGPKTNNTWLGSVPITTLQGLTDKNLHSGITPPQSQGIAGDFYIDYIDKKLYGPRTSFGWDLNQAADLQTFNWATSGNTAVTNTNYIGSSLSSKLIVQANKKEAIRIVPTDVSGDYLKSINIGFGTYGAEPDSSAMLDVMNRALITGATNVGISIPNIQLTSINQISPFTVTPKVGLLIYNTNTSVSGSVSPGFYNWNGTNWFTLGPITNINSAGVPGINGSKIITVFGYPNTITTGGKTGDYAMAYLGSTVYLVGPNNGGWSVGVPTLALNGYKGDQGDQGPIGNAERILASTIAINSYTDGVVNDYYFYKNISGASPKVYWNGPKQANAWNPTSSTLITGFKGDLGASIYTGVAVPSKTLIGLKTGDYYLQSSTYNVMSPTGTDVTKQSVIMWGPYNGSSWVNTSTYQTVGSQGLLGESGSQIHRNTNSPVGTTIGSVGDFYLQMMGVYGFPTYSVMYYGPKDNTGWSNIKSFNIAGSKGVTGDMMLTGTVPISFTNQPGKDDDFYLFASGTGSTASAILHGPKTNGFYSTNTNTLNLVGPIGKPGINASNGIKLISTDLVPNPDPKFTSVGNIGDYYYQKVGIGTSTTGLVIFGPKTGINSATDWGSGVSLVGKNSSIIFSGLNIPVDAINGSSATLGDYYIRSVGNAQVGTHTVTYYGPADVNGTWNSAAFPLQGMHGVDGFALKGSPNDPAPAEGLLGSYFFNNKTGVMWGPKITANTWVGTQTLLVKGAEGLKDAWSLQGNAGTNPISNYVGTKDLNDLVVKTNAIRRMQVSSSSGNIAFNRSIPDLSSVIDMQETTIGSLKGVLIPQVFLTVSTSASFLNGSPSIGLLVYNKGMSTSTMNVGFYYWNATEWTQLRIGNQPPGLELKGEKGFRGISTFNSSSNNINDLNRYNNGDYFLDQVNNVLWGPMDLLSWTANPVITKSVSIVGPQGQSILSGAANPTNTTGGLTPDFYINSTSKIMFGPKSSNSWSTASTFTYNLDPQGTLPFAKVNNTLTPTGYIPTMTGPGLPANFVASSNYNSVQAYLGFASGTSTWNPNTTVLPQFLTIKLDKPIAIYKYELNGAGPLNYPNAYQVQASNDSLNWDVLDNQLTPLSASTPSALVSNSVTSGILYKFYRLHIAQIVGNGGVSKFQIFEKNMTANDIWYVDKTNKQIGLKIKSTQEVRSDAIGLMIGDGSAVGIGNRPFNGELQMSNTNKLKKVVLKDNNLTPTTQNFIGFGNDNVNLRYQIAYHSASSIQSHNFNSALQTATNSTELMRIQKNGLVAVNRSYAAESTGSFQVAGDAFNIDANNKIGIGTLTVMPDYKAQVIGNIAADMFQSTSTQINGWRSIYDGGLYMKDEKWMRVLNEKPILSNNTIISPTFAVGLPISDNPTTPNAAGIKLHIEGSAYLGGNPGNTSVESGLLVNKITPFSHVVIPGEGIFDIEGSTKITKLGIGNETPEHRIFLDEPGQNHFLSVNGSSRFDGPIIISQNLADKDLILPTEVRLYVVGNMHNRQNLTVGKNNDVLGYVAVGKPTTQYKLHVEGTARFFDGNIGIGNNAPLYKIDARGSATFAINSKTISLRSKSWFVFNNSTQGGWKDSISQAGFFYHSQDPDYLWFGHTDLEGSVGVKTKQVWVNNKILIGTNVGDAMVHVGNASNRGTIKCTEIQGNSDIRYKKNILDIVDAIEKVKLMQGRTYNWRVEEFPLAGYRTDNQYGFIAQELEKIIPELVITGSDGYKSINYMNLSSVLVEAIKDLAKERAELEKELNSSNEQINKEIELFMTELNRITLLTAKK